MNPKPPALSPESMEAFALPVLNAIQNPVIMLNADGYVVFANWEAEAFFGASAAHLSRYVIEALIPSAARFWR